MFGARWDPERYARVLTACALEDDLAGFSAGDKTELGERGLNLSGGLLPTLPHPTIPYPPPHPVANIVISAYWRPDRAALLVPDVCGEP